MRPSRLIVALSFVASVLAGRHGHAEVPARAAPAPALARAADYDFASGSTSIFPYQQRHFLYARNAPGGLAWVPAGAARGASMPVVVFLHGMNADELMHPWFGPPYGDLRSVVEPLITSGSVAPFILAAPTHTRFATGATAMWPHFDLGDFLDATEAAISDVVKIDRARVIVVGHSGAGCNATGGILGESVRRAKPVALLDVDGCLDEPVIPLLAESSASTKVLFFWQRTWARPVAALESACPACKIEEISDLPAGTSPHNAILPEALRRALPSLLRRASR